MSLVKILRLRKTISTTDSTKTISGGDIKLEISVETKTENTTPPISYEEWELKFITLDLPADVPITKKYSNKDSQYGTNQIEVLEFIVPDFIQRVTLTKLRDLKYSGVEADLLSQSYYKIIQDPFSEQLPLTRNYNTDGYFLNNGTEVSVRWNTGASVSIWDSKYVEAEIGGVNYSLADGSESWDQSLSLPGSTPSVPFIQTAEDIQFAKEEKKKITKFVTAINGSKSFMLSSGQIKLFEKPNEPDFFPGEVKDLDLVTKLVDVWKTKIPNYDLKISNPNNQAGGSLEFKDPLQGLSPSIAGADNTGSSVSTADEVKFELSIVYDKNVTIKADQDLPNIEIYVGEPPALGEFLFQQDEFDDLALLDEEYNEDTFRGEEELVFSLKETKMEGADGELSIDEKKVNAIRTEELNFEGLSELRPLPKKGVGKTETDRANNLYAVPYGLEVKTVAQAQTAAYKKLLEVTNFGTEMYFSGVAMGNKQKLKNSSTGGLENVFMSELKYNGKLTWTNSAGIIYKTDDKGTFKKSWSKLDLLVHKAARPGLESAYAQIQKEYGLDKMWDLGLNTSSGTYYPRAKRGGTNPSIHSWGAAIDICAGPNGLTTKCPTALFCGQDYKRFIDIMEAYGWYSLGRSWGQDYMHFQAV